MLGEILQSDLWQCIPLVNKALKGIHFSTVEPSHYVLHKFDSSSSLTVHTVFIHRFLHSFPVVQIFRGIVHSSETIVSCFIMD